MAALGFIHVNMSRLSALAACAALLCMTAAFLTFAQQAYPATLAGHAVLPQSFVAAPKRVDARGSVEGLSADRPTDVENVDVVDATHIAVGNDNNLPFSSSRAPNVQDDNELVLLEVGELLRAR